MARMIARPRPDRDARSEPFEIFRRPQRSLPARLLGLAVRLRAELTIAVAVVVAWVWLTDRLPTWAAVLVLIVPAIVVAVVGPSRRYVVRRGYAVLTRHRLRAVFIERRVMNFTGNLPVLLWSRPTPVGERVWLLLRAGIDLVDLERNLDYIASGCFARESRATARRSMTALVVLDVVRRDPLAAGPPIRPTHTADPPAQRPARRPRLRVIATEKGA